MANDWFNAVKKNSWIFLRAPKDLRKSKPRIPHPQVRHSGGGIKSFLKNKLLVVALFILIIPTFSAVLRPGYFPMHDDMQAMRLYEIDKCIRDGQIPCRWVPDMGYGYGYPQFNYYAPLPYYIMEVFHLVGFGFLDSVKAGMVLSILVSAWGMYSLAKFLWGRVGGFISSLLYIYAPYRATDFYVRGAVGELWAMAFLPFIFLYTVKSIKGDKNAWVFLAFSLAALFTSHNISSLIFFPIVFVWTGFLIIFERGNSPSLLKNRIVKLFIGILSSLAISAFFVLPAWFEKGLVHTETLLGGYFDYINHFVGLKQLLLDTHWGYGTSEVGPYDDILLTVGLIQWILPLITITLLFFLRRKRQAYLLSFITVLGWVLLFLAHPRSLIFWEKIPIMAFIQFPWRFLVFATFLFSLGAGASSLVFSKNSSVTYTLFCFLIVVTFTLNRSYFTPRIWINISDTQKFSGDDWVRQQTISIFDYLPIYAERPPSQAAYDKPEIMEGYADVKVEQKGTNWQKWQVDIKSPSATLQAPIYYFPEWRVQSDDKLVPISFNNKLGLITFSLPLGKHEVRLKLYDTPVRRFASLLSLVTIIALPIYSKRRK